MERDERYTERARGHPTFGRCIIITVILIIAVIAVVTTFSVQNASPVAVSFLHWRFEASLAVVIVLSLLAGVVIGMTLLSWIRLRRSRRKKQSSAPANETAANRRVN